MFREIYQLDHHQILVFVDFDHILEIQYFHLSDVVYDEHKVDFDEENLFDIIHN
jgi:hypothetical protein